MSAYVPAPVRTCPHMPARTCAHVRVRVRTCPRFNLFLKGSSRTEEQSRVATEQNRSNK